jgi:hypothetical protein
VNRVEWQGLAQERIGDAKALLDAEKWSGAYYLAGYAVECGLKSCILAHLEGGIIFDDRKYLKNLVDCWTHNLESLIEFAGLKDKLDQNLDVNGVFAGFWNVAIKWSETSRYVQTSQANAVELFEAVSQEPDGVLQWIRLHW